MLCCDSMQLLFTEMASLWLVAPLDKGGFHLNRSSLTAAAVVSGMITLSCIALYNIEQDKTEKDKNISKLQLSNTTLNRTIPPCLTHFET